MLMSGLCQTQITGMLFGKNYKLSKMQIFAISIICSSRAKTRYFEHWEKADGCFKTH